MRKRVEQCSLKIYILIDLLVSEHSLARIFNYDDSMAAAVVDSYGFMMMNGGLGAAPGAASALNSDLGGAYAMNYMAGAVGPVNSSSVATTLNSVVVMPVANRAPLTQHRNSNESASSSGSATVAAAMYGLDLKDMRNNPMAAQYGQYNQPQQQLYARARLGYYEGNGVAAYAMPPHHTHTHHHQQQSEVYLPPNMKNYRKSDAKRKE